jgi:hypothetical protein
MAIMRSPTRCRKRSTPTCACRSAGAQGPNYRGSPLRPRSLVRALVSSIQAEPARPGGDDGRARPVDGAYDHYALGAALRTGVRATLETVCPSSISQSLAKRIISARGVIDAYVRFWFRRSTVRFILTVAVTLFAIDVVFYYWKIAPYAQSEPISERRESGVMHTEAERIVREGRYTYFADPSR